VGWEKGRWLPTVAAGTVVWSVNFSQRSARSEQRGVQQAVERVGVEQEQACRAQCGSQSRTQDTQPPSHALAVHSPLLTPHSPPSPASVSLLVRSISSHVSSLHRPRPPGRGRHRRSGRALAPPPPRAQARSVSQREGRRDQPPRTPLRSAMRCDASDTRRCLTTIALPMHTLLVILCIPLPP